MTLLHSRKRLEIRLVVALSLLFALGMSAAAYSPSSRPGRVEQDFDAGWRFHLGDDGYTDTVSGTILTHWQWEPAEPGVSLSVPPPDMDAWRPATIGADVFGNKPGFAWYKTTFTTSQSRAILYFEGVDDNADVFVNGTKIFHHAGWDTPFDVDATGSVLPGGLNHLDVLVENTAGPGGISQEVTLRRLKPRPVLMGPARPGYADTAWRTVHLPHDWMIEGVPGTDPAAMDGPFDKNSPAGAGGGYLNGGVGWYRKTFSLPAAQKSRRAFLLFDGVYMDSDVWLNGAHLGRHPYGYTSFGYDLTPYLKYGAAHNVLAVRCNVRQPCSRFYSGAGIYRHVHLFLTSPVHVPLWGTFVTTPHITSSAAQVVVRTRVQNDGSTSVVPVFLTTTILAPDGRRVASGTIERSNLPAGMGYEFTQTLSVPRPHLWSTTDPALHTVLTEVRVGGVVTDTYRTPFGIRTLAFTKDNGFLLNGKRVQIHGVCDHHDLGALGAAVNTRAMARQLEILRSFGCNALRTSHYPPAPELLDLCDKMGFLVMDEAFDEWKSSKTPLGYGRFFDQWSEPDLVSMTHRDRNHPSVILWSIGNEIIEQGATNGYAMSKRLADIVRREDPTRFVTSAMSNPYDAVRTGFATPLDVFGVNYNIGFYDSSLAKGHWPMLGSETASALNSRGEYDLALDDAGNVSIPQHTQDNQLPGYDVIRPGWGNTAEQSLKALRDSPWMAGEFVWTGFDYIGEPTPYGWPSRSSYFGIVDLSGFPKDRYFLYQSQWTTRPVVHILPQNWNWPGLEGKAIPVWIYTNADTVELFLNGRSLGVQKTKDTSNLHLEFSVPYAPGVLKAVGTKNGRVFAVDEVHTAGAPAKLELVPDRASLHADGQDLSFVQVRVLDKDGNVCPDARDEIKFAVTGAGSLAGVDDGDATNHESFQRPQHQAFHGLALAIVRSTDKPGSIRISASAAGLQGASSTVRTR